MKYNPTLHKLSNGVTVILDPMDIETVHMHVTFKTGACDENSHEYGITHFCEHMFCKGSARFPDAKQRKDFIENHGGTTNAVTSLIRLCFFGRIVAENLERLIDVLSEMLQCANFDKEKIQIERGAILDEMRRGLDKPERAMFDFVMKSIYGVCVPNGTLTLGNEETIRSFTREQLLEYASQHMSAKNCVIVISGGISDTDALLALLEKRFAFLPTHEVNQNLKLEYTPKVVHNSTKAKNVKINMLFPCLLPDTFENMYAHKCIKRFESFLVREFMENIRQKHGLVYGIRKMAYGYSNSCSDVTGFETETSPENVARVVALMAKTAYRVYMTNPITQTELDRMYNLGRLADAEFLEKSASRCDMLDIFYRAYEKIYDFYGLIEMTKSITPADVIKYTRGYFDGPMSVVTQGADFDGDLKQIWIDNFRE